MNEATTRPSPVALRTRAFSLVGLLVTMACIVVLMAILLGGLNTAMTGAGNTIPGSVASVKDQMTLQEIFKGMLASTDITGASRRSSGGGFPVPSLVQGQARRELDTSASMWSLVVMQHGVAPRMLISANERNPNVEVCEQYDFRAYDPAAGVFWDPKFKANLADGSNVSFAHVPLWGRRFDTHWAKVSLDSMFPLFGTRGPKDGDPTALSYTLGRNGRWAGHMCFADGHAEWLEDMALPGRLDAGPDKLFWWEEGASGGDAVIAFTRMVGPRGPTLEFD